MLTREQIAETLNNNRNGRVYRFEFNEAGQLNRFAARDIETDSQIALEAQAGNLERAKTGRLDQGDLIYCKDGKIERVAHVYERDNADGSICYQPGHNGTEGSFYLYTDTMSHSGSLDTSVNRRLRLSEETAPAWVWFFSLRQTGGGRGVYCQICVPVWIEL